MTATYVTVAQLKDVLGCGTLYPDNVLESICQSAEDLINGQLWFDNFPVVGVTVQSNVATVVLSATGSFATGQSVTLTNCGATYDGTYTVTGTYPWTQGSASYPYFSAYFPYNNTSFPLGYSLVQFSKVTANDPYHLVLPYGTIAGIDTKQTSYSTTPAINQAALQVATKIFQARMAPSGQGMSVDGYAPQPMFTMSSSLIASVRGLLAPYLNPRGMCG